MNLNKIKEIQRDRDHWINTLDDLYTDKNKLEDPKWDWWSVGIFGNSSVPRIYLNIKGYNSEKFRLIFLAEINDRIRSIEKMLGKEFNDQKEKG